MSFRFSGLGHSLEQVGSSVAPFTDHTSNFTKDVLLKGTEEVEQQPGSRRKERELSQTILRPDNQTLKTPSSDL